MHYDVCVKGEYVHYRQFFEHWNCTKFTLVMATYSPAFPPGDDMPVAYSFMTDVRFSDVVVFDTLKL